MNNNLRAGKENEFVPFKCLLVISVVTFVLLTPSCKNQTKQSASEKTDSVKPDTFHVQQSKVSSSKYKERFPEACDFDKFLKDPHTPELAKQIFNEEDWHPEKNMQAIDFVDSLKSTDRGARRFYFKVVTRIQAKADGAVSEAFCMNATEYVQKHTLQFIKYFDEADCFPEKDLDAWASIVASEYGIIEDSTFTRIALNKLYAGFRKDTKQCTKAQTERMERFIKLIEAKLW